MEKFIDEYASDGGDSQNNYESDDSNSKISDLIDDEYEDSIYSLPDQNKNTSDYESDNESVNDRMHARDNNSDYDNYDAITKLHELSDYDFYNLSVEVYKRMLDAICYTDMVNNIEDAERLYLYNKKEKALKDAGSMFRFRLLYIFILFFLKEKEINKVCAKNGCKFTLDVLFPIGLFQNKKDLKDLIDECDENDEKSLLQFYLKYYIIFRHLYYNSEECLNMMNVALLKVILLTFPRYDYIMQQYDIGFKTDDGRFIAKVFVSFKGVFCIPKKKQLSFKHFASKSFSMQNQKAENGMTNNIIYNRDMFLKSSSTYQEYVLGGKYFDQYSYKFDEIKCEYKRSRYFEKNKCGENKRYVFILDKFMNINNGRYDVLFYRKIIPRGNLFSYIHVIIAFWEKVDFKIKKNLNYNDERKFRKYGLNDLLEKLIKSFCGDIYIYTEAEKLMKKAIILSLISNVNLFIIGPPGTAKSQLLRYCSNHILKRNSSFIEGSQVTEAGLTVSTYSKSDIQAGVLVANKDFIFIDELPNMSENALASLKTSMTTGSVNKFNAFFKGSLKNKSCFICTGNFKVISSIEGSNEVEKNCYPLSDEFKSIFINVYLDDEISESSDIMKSTDIILNHIKSSKVTRIVEDKIKADITYNRIEKSEIKTFLKDNSGHVKLEKIMQLVKKKKLIDKYDQKKGETFDASDMNNLIISLKKKKINNIEDGVKDFFEEFYCNIREIIGEKNIDAKYCEKIIKISCAYAKLGFSDIVKVIHCQYACLFICEIILNNKIVENNRLDVFMKYYNSLQMDDSHFYLNLNNELHNIFLCYEEGIDIEDFREYIETRNYNISNIEKYLDSNVFKERYRVHNKSIIRKI